MVFWDCPYRAMKKSRVFVCYKAVVPMGPGQIFPQATIGPSLVEL
jgi:hypothetical protein